jgi:hypothetical protein
MSRVEHSCLRFCFELFVSHRFDNTRGRFRRHNASQTKSRLAEQLAIFLFRSFPAARAHKHHHIQDFAGMGDLPFA